MQLHSVSETVIDARLRQPREEAVSTLEEVRGGAESAARVWVHPVRGEPVAAVLTGIARQASQLVVVGRRHAHAPRVQGRHDGRDGLRIAYQSPIDLLMLS